MMGISGKVEYLYELAGRYDWDECIQQVAVQELVNLTGCTFGEAQDYFDRDRMATNASNCHDFVTQCRGEGA